MSEQMYNKVFEQIQSSIKSSLVPKTQLEEAQQKIKDLESMLENSTTEFEKLKTKYDEQNLSIEILQAEKETLRSDKRYFQARTASLLAEKEIHVAERKSLQLRHKGFEAERAHVAIWREATEAKYKEVALKLKQKTLQYDSLLKSQEANKNNVTRVSTGTQTIKEEPQEIGIVNIPASKSSKENATKAGAKRQNASNSKDQPEIPRIKAKRKKVEVSYSSPKTTMNTTQRKVTFKCEDCVYRWAYHVQKNFRGDPGQSGVPDPKSTISLFSSLEDYKKHLDRVHKYFPRFRLNPSFAYPNSAFVCKTCDSSFACQHRLDRHIDIEHVDLEMTKEQFYNLYIKYVDVKRNHVHECQC